MTGQEFKRKTLKDSQIRVVTNWEHTEEVAPAFKHLMQMLLRSKEGMNDGNKSLKSER